MSGFSLKSLGLFSCRQICGNARQAVQIFSFACLVLATTSCVWWASPIANSHEVKEPSETDFLTEERKNYTSDKPEVCLALSGGGIRSAAYSIGVLKGLYLTEQLDKVKIISAVSGGSYAATWFYAQYADQPSSGVSKLDRWRNVLSYDSITKVAGKAKYFVFTLGATGILAVELPNSDSSLPSLIIQGGGNLILLPIHLGIYLGGMLWSYHPPLSEGHDTWQGNHYEAALESAFHPKPDSRGRISIQAASQDLPYLIVNATIQGVEKAGEPRLANDIFEFTSYGMGSPSVGYKSWDKLKHESRADAESLFRIASISGAAVDKSTTNIKGFKWLNVLGRELGLGYNKLTPTYNEKEDWLKRFFVLTDGGDSENLGVYSLIKRNCKEIIVVDAEHDGRPETFSNWFVRVREYIFGKTFIGYEDTYKFDGYEKLKKNLRADRLNLKKDLKIAHLDQVLEPTSDPKQSPDKWGCWSEVVTLTHNRFECSDPIHGGYVYRCLDEDCTKPEQLDMHVTYVKLSANRTLLDDPSKDSESKQVYGPRITDFYNKTYRESRTERDWDKDFPQYLTGQLVWDEKQFLAIAELGCRAVVRKYAENLLSSSEGSCIAIDRMTTTGTADKR